MDYTASAPAKIILLGEHAVNRGASALAVSVGLRARCSLRLGGEGFVLAGGNHRRRASRNEIFAAGAVVEAARASESYSQIQLFARSEFFGPAMYLLAGFEQALPKGADIRFESMIPVAAGLGSGGATAVALAAAMTLALDQHIQPRRLAALAHRADIVAHGGTASGLDSQTSLYGGAIRYTAEREGEPIACAPGLSLVIGNTGVYAATSDVNGRVRAWLAERPTRLHYFHEIGTLARHAESVLMASDWPELGRLMNLNQLLLERIGVSCPELEVLNEAALAAGAWGAKLSGSGGGGIMIALADEDTREAVAKAITAAGGTAILAPVGVEGVQVDA